MSRAIGIDLGTTNSIASVCIDGKVQIIRSRDHEYFTPSVISYRRPRTADRDGELYVGRAALNYASLAPEDTVFSIKRLIGRTIDDPKVADVSQRYPYRVVASDDGSTGIRVQVGPHMFTPVEISAKILRALVDDAERALGEEVPSAIITVPAYFSEAQRNATAEAGLLAGLDVLKVIDEPTAAAIAFGMDHIDDRHRVLVYDLGGGTFDISVIQMVGANFNVLEIAGDRWLGGDDFDRLIVEQITAWARSRYDVDPSKDRRYLMVAKLAAERAKVALSQGQVTDILIPAAVRAPDGPPLDVDFEFTREAFEKLIRPLVDRSLDQVRAVLTAQSLGPDDITRVLLVGGSTSVPLVHAELERHFGAARVDTSVDPMQSVSIGAAHLAARMYVPDAARPQRQPGAVITLSEVTARGLGIETIGPDGRGDYFSVVIPKGTPYPLEHGLERNYRTTTLGQLRIPVYEGDSAVASRNDVQGNIDIPLPPEVAISSPVVVRFNFDKNRVLTVHVRVVDHDISQEVRLTRAQPRAPDDNWHKPLEAIVRTAEHFLVAHRDLLEPGTLSKLQSDISKARQALVDRNATLGAQISSALHMALMGSGVASTFFLAERAEEWATPSDREVLKQGRRDLREAVQKSDAARIERLNRALQSMIVSLLQLRAQAGSNEATGLLESRNAPARERGRA